MNNIFPSAPEDFSFEDLVRRSDILPLLLRRYVEESIVAIVPLEPSEIEDSQKRIVGDSDLNEWLHSKGWTKQDLMIASSRQLALSKFANQRFSPGLEDSFLASRGGRDEIVYSLLRVRDSGLARELYIRIAEGELPFPEAARHFGEGPEARHQGLIGPMSLSQLQPPRLAAALRGLQPGELAKPLVLGEWHLIMRLEHFKPARLDDAMRRTLLQEQLESFLDQRVKLLQTGQPLEPLHFDSDVCSDLAPQTSDSSDLT